MILRIILRKNKRLKINIAETFREYYMNHHIKTHCDDPLKCFQQALDKLSDLQKQFNIDDMAELLFYDNSYNNMWEIIDSDRKVPKYTISFNYDTGMILLVKFRKMVKKDPLYMVIRGNYNRKYITNLL